MTLAAAGIPGGAGNSAVTGNGTTSSVQIPSLTVGATASIEIWAKRTAAITNYEILWKNSSAVTWTVPYPIDLMFHAGLISLNNGDGDANPFCAIPTNFNDGNYHQYVVVLNGTASTAKLYYDGALCG